MSILKLNTETMVSLSEHWRTSARADMQQPLLAGLPALFDAWAEDAKGLAARADETAEVGKLRAQATALDATHDDALNACYHYMTALAELHARPLEVRALRDLLMPGGLRMKTRSYQDQGAAAAVAKASLTEDVAAQLAALSAPETDLVATMRQWIEAGLTLRTVDAQRASMQGQGSTLNAELRQRWMRLVKALKHGAALSDLDDAARSRLFAKLDEATR